ncbi:MAG: FGGY-family carbohydrate kinase [Clostridia bacterium]|nr:FGGY-family carbohydrate kinase [Clostridia bacterium]
MYIGIDLGTTGCKTVLFAEDSSVICEYNKEYELIFKGTYVEQDANDWWRLVLEGMSHVVSESGVHEIKGISVSTQGISFVPVDENGNTLYNAISWLDMRAEAECNELIRRFGHEKVFNITGKHCLCDYSLPKIRWFADNHPEIIDKTWKILFPLDYLNLKLCKNAVTDYTIAGGTMLYDIHDKCWDQELLAFAGIEERLLPDVFPMGTDIGNILPEVAEKVGITGDCRIYMGGQDQKLAAIGAGIDDGICTVSFGTATAISRLGKAIDYDADSAVTLFRFDDEKYISEVALMTTGAALRWLTRTLYGGISYKDMDALAAQSEPGANGVRFKSDLSVGGVISGITLSTTSSDIVYALYEGVSEDIANAVSALGGARQLKVFGGGAKSEIWCSILARITGMDVEILSIPETAALGAAVLASGGRILPAAVKKIINPDNNL